MSSTSLDFLAHDDAARLDHADVGQSRPSGRGFALVLLEQLLYRVGILLLLRLRRLILHRRSLVRRHRRTWTRVLRLVDPVRHRGIPLRRLNDRYRALARIVRVRGVRIGRTVPDERTPIAADFLAELQDNRRAPKGLVVVLRLNQILVQVALVQRIVAAGRRARARFQLQLTLRAVLFRQTFSI